MRLSTLLVLLFAASVFGHGGGTDSRGGHVDHRTGRYHYHGRRSQPAPMVLWSNSYSMPSTRQYPVPTGPVVTRENVNVRMVNRELKRAMGEFRKLRKLGKDTIEIRAKVHELQAMRKKMGS